MASQNPDRAPMYPPLDTANPQTNTFTTSTSSSLYPTIDMSDLTTNLFPHPDPVATRVPYPQTAPIVEPYSPSAPIVEPYSPSAPPEETSSERLIAVPNTVLNLIDKHYSVELSAGDLQIHRLKQGGNTVAAVAAVGDDVQWPLTKDLATVKIDSSHYFFSFKPPKESDQDDENEVLSYGLTILPPGNGVSLLKELDGVLEKYSNFKDVGSESKTREISVGDTTTTKEGQCAAYWTTLAPNVEEYSGTAARLIAAGSGQMVKGILWCGDVTMDRLKWGNDVLKKRMVKKDDAEIDPKTLKRIKRAKRVTKMTEKVANGMLSGVVKVSGFFTGSVANSKLGKKFFNMLPGEIVLASLDGFSKVCDAVEVAGKNVMSTSSTVTTGLVTHKYGDEAGKATREGLDAAGHAMGTAWAVFKIRKALNPKSVLKPSTLAKSAAKSALADKKSSSSK